MDNQILKILLQLKQEVKEIKVDEVDLKVIKSNKKLSEQIAANTERI